MSEMGRVNLTLFLGWSLSHYLPIKTERESNNFILTVEVTVISCSIY